MAGTGETRGLIMVCPSLEEYVAAEMHKEAATAKERRKLREERAATRPPKTPDKAGGKGGGTDK